MYLSISKIRPDEDLLCFIGQTIPDFARKGLNWCFRIALIPRASPHNTTHRTFVFFNLGRFIAEYACKLILSRLGIRGGFERKKFLMRNAKFPLYILASGMMLSRCYNQVIKLKKKKSAETNVSTENKRKKNAGIGAKKARPETKKQERKKQRY